MFDWPTEWVQEVATDPGNFDRSEFIAWNSARGLSDALHQINNTMPVNPATGKRAGKLSVMAHSHGNITLAEALYKNEAAGAAGNKLADNVIFSQAALSSHYF